MPEFDLENEINVVESFLNDFYEKYSAGAAEVLEYYTLLVERSLATIN